MGRLVALRVLGIGLVIWSAAVFAATSEPGSNKRAAPATQLPSDAEITRRYVVQIGVALSSGAQQTISETVSCAGERQHGRSGWQYAKSPANGYTIFPNKEVVVAYLPRVCSARDGAVPATFIPFVVWIDNAESPSVMEFIVHHGYYERARTPRIRIPQIKVEQSWSAPVPTMDRRFATIYNRYDGGQLSVKDGRPYARDLDSIFHGVTAYIYPESVWRTFPSLAAHLETLTDTTLIDWETIKSSAAGILGFCGVAEVGAGPEAKCEIWGFDSRPYSHAMVTHGDVWSIDRSAPGIERYFLLRRYDAVKEGCSTREKSCAFFNYRFNVSMGSARLSLGPDESRFVFDPKTRSLNFVVPHLFATRAMD